MKRRAFLSTIPLLGCLSFVKPAPVVDVLPTDAEIARLSRWPYAIMDRFVFDRVWGDRHIEGVLAALTRCHRVGKCGLHYTWKDTPEGYTRNYAIVEEDGVEDMWWFEWPQKHRRTCRKTTHHLSKPTPQRSPSNES